MSDSFHNVVNHDDVVCLQWKFNTRMWCRLKKSTIVNLSAADGSARIYSDDAASVAVDCFTFIVENQVLVMIQKLL